MLNGLMERKMGVVVNVLEHRGLAFAQLENGDDVFIDRNLAEGLEVADQVDLVVVTNHKHHAKTPWRAIKLEVVAPVYKPEPAAARFPTAAELQDMIMEFLEEDPDAFFSSHYIQKSLGLLIGHSDVRVEADKLHAAQKICRAKVQGPGYQKRTEFFVYSKNIEAFLFEDEEVVDE